MGLRVVGHLQPVLDAAQKAVVVDQRVGGGGVDAPGRGQRAQRRAGRADPQRPHPAAPDQLLRLGEELDLADAAAAGLDVVPLDRDLAAALVRLDLPLDRMDVLDRREIEVPAPDKGLQLGEELPRRDQVAGHRPGLYQRRALPVLPDGLVIGQRRRDRDRQRRRARVRAQPQIGAKNVAIAGALVENAHEVAREAAEQRLRAVRRGRRRAAPGRKEGSDRYRSNS